MGEFIPRSGIQLTSRAACEQFRNCQIYREIIIACEGLPPSSFALAQTPTFSVDWVCFCAVPAASFRQT